MIKNKKPKIVYVGVDRAGVGALEVLAESRIAKDLKLVGVRKKNFGKGTPKADIDIKLSIGEFCHSTAEIGKRAALQVYNNILEALMFEIKT